VGEKKHKLIPRPPPSPTPISGPGSSKTDDKLLKAQEKHPKSMHGRTELTLSGKIKFLDYLKLFIISSELCILLFCMHSCSNCSSPQY
jgi:hypothetical protein